jgi:hypothetical protein
MNSPYRLPLIECTVTFLPASEGGRAHPFPHGALSGDTYRPHLVVGDPSQRQAIIVNGNVLAEEYIGVAFHEGPPDVPVGIPVDVSLSAMFYPHPIYDRLVPGATFTVREGPKIVAYGTVKQWVNRTT